MTASSGLTAAEVQARHDQGRANLVSRNQSRSVWDIVRANILTRFNAIIGVLLVVVLVFGPIQDALFGLVIVVNSAVGIVQELRAKRKLDALALLERAPVRVRRDGTTVEVPPSDVVIDDVVLLGAGEKVPVDGTVVESDGLELDESLLTGEADPIAKEEMHTVRSGSYVVSGAGAFVAVKVGDDAYANRLVADVRRFELAHSELMIGINRILRAITWVIVPLGILLIISQLVSAGSLREAMVGTVAGIVPTVPEGLVLMTSVAFAVGVIRLAQRRCLVQELPAIEMLARVDVLCLDKTGTLTAPELDLDEIALAPGTTTVDERRTHAALAALARMEERPNATVRAIAEGAPAAQGWTPTETLPFSSARKFSAAVFPDGAWCLGGADVILAPDEPMRSRADALAADGLRVLAVVELPDGRLPGQTVRGTARALVVLRQRLRPEAAETMRYLIDEGVTLKIFSGDHPAAVGAVAVSAGIPGAQSPVDARTLPEEPSALAQAMRSSSVFGRVSPEQKRAFVDALRRDGRTVGMTGDGVNDALALKNADLGIAMGSGSPATRGVAKVVLLDNNFGTMPHVLAEGRRVLGNIERVASLFLVKTMYSLVLAVLVGLAHVPFPLLPRHVTLVGSLTIGIPGFFLALAPNTERFRPGFIGRVLGRAAPAGLVCGVAAFTAYGLARLHTVSDQTVDRSTAALTLFLSAAWMLALVARPYTWWRAALVAGMVGAFGLVAAVPFARRFFALDFSDPTTLMIGLVISGAAAVVITVIQRIDGGGQFVLWARDRTVGAARTLRPVRARAAAWTEWLRDRAGGRAEKVVRDLRPALRGLLATASRAAAGGTVGPDREAAMPSSSSLAAAGRRAGYSVAAAALIGIWFILNVWPGWTTIGFLGGNFNDVLGLLNASLLIGVIANLLYALRDAVWLRAVGGLVTSGIGLAVLVLLWRVFPFAFPEGSAWNTVARTFLVIGMVGTVIDLIVQGTTLIRVALGTTVPPGARNDARR